jgi:hypothetical protein
VVSTVLVLLAIIVVISSGGGAVLSVMIRVSVVCVSRPAAVAGLASQLCFLVHTDSVCTSMCALRQLQQPALH